MEYLFIGEIVGTHGIKGEVRIVSDIEYKDSIFKPGIHLYIGKNKEEHTIASYRFHKIYDMVTFTGIDDINDVLIYKGEKVYVNREEITFPSFLKQDLIGMDVISDGKYRGQVTNIMKNKVQDILVVKQNEKKYLVPYVDELIEQVDLEQQTIYVQYIKGLLDED